MVELANRLKKQELDLFGACLSQLNAADSPEGKISFTGDTPEQEMSYEVKEALIAAVRDGGSVETETLEAELKAAVVRNLKAVEGWTVNPEEVMLTPGGEAALSLTMQCVLNEGDEVLALAPYTERIPAMIRMAGGVIKTLACVEDEGFKPSVEDLSRVMTSRVKVLVISNPSPVTGAVYSEEELKEIAELAQSKGCVMVSDERYSAFVYDAPFKGMAVLSPKFHGNCITVRDAAKSFSLNGQKLGMIVAPEETVRKLSSAQNASFGGPDRLSLAAALAAYRETPSSNEKMMREYRERRDYLVEALNGMHGVRCQTPAGGIFLYPNIQYYLAKEVGGIVPTSSVEFSNILSSRAGMGLVPGSVFGMEGYVRMSLSQPMEKLREGVKRMRKLLDR